MGPFPAGPRGDFPIPDSDNESDSGRVGNNRGFPSPFPGQIGIGGIGTGDFRVWSRRRRRLTRLCRADGALQPLPLLVPSRQVGQSGSVGKSSQDCNHLGGVSHFRTTGKPLIIHCIKHTINASNNGRQLNYHAGFVVRLFGATRRTKPAMARPLQLAAIGEAPRICRR
jgi:hypothetical protein